MQRGLRIGVARRAVAFGASAAIAGAALLAGLAAKTVAEAADFALSGAAEVTLAGPFPHGVDYTGVYLAQDLGFFAAEGLRVRLAPASKDPLARLEQGGADAAIAWTADALTARAAGAQLVEIARLIAGSTLTLACRDAASKQARGPAALAGLRIGRPEGPAGRGLDLWLATLGLDAGSGGRAAVTVPQPAKAAAVDPALFDCLTLRRHADLADAPEVYTPTFEVGTLGAPMAEDALYAPTAAVADPQRRERLARLLRALAAGWRAAEVDPRAAAQAVAARTGGPVLSVEETTARLAQRRAVAPADGPIGAPDPAAIEAAAVWMLNAGARPALDRFREGGWSRAVIDAVPALPPPGG